ncbi:hypothetical protein ACNRWW_02030 [Metabacillus sp. HB246100]
MFPELILWLRITGPGANKTAYWIDVYYGYNSSGAFSFGNQRRVSYHATY